MENVSCRVVGFVHWRRGGGVLAALLPLPRVWRTVFGFVGISGRVRERPRAPGGADIFGDAFGVLYPAPGQSVYLCGGNLRLALPSFYTWLRHRARWAHGSGYVFGMEVRLAGARAGQQILGLCRGRGYRGSGSICYGASAPVFLVVFRCAPLVA